MGPGGRRRRRGGAGRACPPVLRSAVRRGGSDLPRPPCPPCPPRGGDARLSTPARRLALVSGIVPCRNEERHIPRGLGSVLAGDYPPPPPGVPGRGRQRADRPA